MLKFLRLNHFSLAFLTLLFVTSLHANPFDAPFPFKEGIIHYTISGSQKGSQTTYIKNYGKNQLIHRKSHDKIMYDESYHESLIMIDPQWTYTIDVHHHTATKKPTLLTLLAQEFETLNQVEQKKIETTTTKQHLDLDCITLPIDGTMTLYSKQGQIALVSKTTILGYSVSTKADRIEIKEVADRLFVLDKDLEIFEEDLDFEQVTYLLESLIHQD